ncbi:hypothetical protein H6G97_32830 [Nostoc flagelliforme FACHB-838]|uniref:Uncharacterized protein n=1 Tax=Nostoc flagelliforme FACHB-838 TaxID=2692904 RepID=A0ABR8DX70_9NOSO|nr:hypothetical protein [Nostoc flagelliforme]MBD2534067.1 hypothetical protein [Nostoc flagelliforme FACHB-838]
MNSNSITRSFSLLTLATVVVISGILPAYAESTNFTAHEANFVTNQPEQINTIPNSSATLLTTEPIQPQTAQTPETTGTQEVAQTLEPGRATRSGASYIGVGGNIGITGNTRASPRITPHRDNYVQLPPRVKCAQGCRKVPQTTTMAVIALLANDIDHLPSVSPGQILADFINSGRVFVAHCR